MLIRKILLLVCMSCLGYRACAQTGFCDATSTIINDAPNRFRNIKGRMVQSNFSAVVWECGVQVPGTMASRFVSSMGFFYEGAFLQTGNKNEIRPVYEKYKDLLQKCLAPLGYSMSLSDNFYPGLAEYKKLVFILDLKEGTKVEKAPPHVTLEAIYNKDSGKYTVVMYIFEH